MNRLTIWWFNTICLLGKRKPLEVNDLYSLNADDLSSTLVPRWNRLWEKAIKSFNMKRQLFYQENKGKCELLVEMEEPSEFLKAPPFESDDEKSDVVPLPSIIWRIFIMFKWDIILANVLKCISDLLTFANPLVLKGMITFSEDIRFPIWYGISLATIMFVASELSSLLLNQYYYLMYRVGTRIQTCLTSAVYKKVPFFN